MVIIRDACPGRDGRARMSMREDALDLLAAGLPDGAALLAALAEPFRRSIRLHPLRGTPSGWGELAPVPWHAAGRFTVASADPGGFLDYHTGLAYPQDAASQVPVLLLAPRPGEVVVDACAAPGSKSTQIGLALGDDGLLICCDASAPRRAVLTENLARQGVACALVTPLPVHALAERHAGCADALLVDAPCSGHEARSPRQVARMAERQLALLAAAAPLVRAGGRLVYSTCTPYREEDEGVIAAFLAAHPQWRLEPVALPGIDADLAGLGALRLWPQRQGTEPFFACRLVRTEAAPGLHAARAPRRRAARGRPGARALAARFAAAHLAPRQRPARRHAARRRLRPARRGARPAPRSRRRRRLPPRAVGRAGAHRARGARAHHPARAGVRAMGWR